MVGWLLCFGVTVGYRVEPCSDVTLLAVLVVNLTLLAVLVVKLSQVLMLLC